MSVAAGVLLLTSLVGWLYHGTQLADLGAEHLRLQVTGPARLRPDLDSEYFVTTTSITGEPVSAQVEFAVYAHDGRRIMGHKEKTDESGRLEVTVPAAVTAEERSQAAEDGAAPVFSLEVTASHEGRQAKISTRMAVETLRHAAYLAVDKSVYRPGETIRWHLLALDRFRLVAGRDLPVHFEVRDPEGVAVPGSQQEAVTRGGLALGQFQIPQTLSGGKYTLLARSPQGAFPDQRRTFFIDVSGPPRLIQELTLSRRSYAPGEQVAADLSLQTLCGDPAAGARLEVLALLDGQTIHHESAEATAEGTRHVEFALPEKIERGEGQLFVVADDGAVRETAAWPIPLRLGPVQVSFYPEGGELVADLENRVYFAACDPLGRPVDVRGRVVDGQGRDVTGVATTQQGMGTFSLVPLPGEEYRLVLQDGAAKPTEVRLPHVSTSRKVVLSTGLGVFGEGKPLEFNVRASEAGVPLVASAWCRGMPVGQQTFVTGQVGKANPVAIALDEQAGGVIRLTIYDYRASPPEPVAERLVYRRPARRLQVEVATDRRAHSPGDEVMATVSASDENSRPVQATFVTGVAPQALVSSAAATAAAMPLHFLLGTEVGALDELGDPGAYLSETREAAVALDLFLGTRGAGQPLEKRRDGVTPAAGANEPQERPHDLDGKPVPPAMFDNLMELQQQYRENLAAYGASRTRASNTLTTASFLGGVGLVLLVAMLSLLGIAGGARLWATAIGTATIAMIVGGVLMDPGRWRSFPEGAVPFAPFNLAPADVAGDTAGRALPDVTGGRRAERSVGQSLTGGLPPQPPASGAEGPLASVARCDPQGRASLRFPAPHTPGRFRVLVDACDDQERIGSGHGEFVVRAPLRVEPKVPREVSPGDQIDVPLAIVNDTGDVLPVEVVLEHGDLVELEDGVPRQLQLDPKGRSRMFLPMKVIASSGDGELAFRATAGEQSAAASCPLRVVSPAAPVASSGGPDAGRACPLRLSTRLEAREIAWGQPVALIAELANTADQAQPATVAVLGLPAGLEVLPNQLEELVLAGKLACWETRPRQLVCTWRALAPKETMQLRLNLIAAVPGRFTGPASHACLRDDAGSKSWAEPLTIQVNRD